MSTQAPITPPPSPPAAPLHHRIQHIQFHQTKCGELSTLSPLPENPASPDWPHRGSRRPILEEPVEPKSVQFENQAPLSPISPRASVSGPSGSPSSAIAPRPGSRRSSSVTSEPRPMHPPNDDDGDNDNDNDGRAFCEGVERRPSHSHHHHRRKSHPAEKTKSHPPNPLVPPSRRASYQPSVGDSEGGELRIGLKALSVPQVAQHLAEVQAADVALVSTIAVLDQKFDALLEHFGLDAREAGLKGIHGKLDALMGHFGVQGRS